MVTRSVRVAKKGKGKGKVSVKALLSSAVNSFRVHFFQREAGSLLDLRPGYVTKKGQSRIGTGHEDCETEISGNT